MDKKVLLLLISRAMQY